MYHLSPPVQGLLVLGNLNTTSVTSPLLDIFISIESFTFGMHFHHLTSPSPTSPSDTKLLVSCGNTSSNILILTHLVPFTLFVLAPLALIPSIYDLYLLFCMCILHQASPFYVVSTFNILLPHSIPSHIYLHVLSHCCKVPNNNNNNESGPAKTGPTGPVAPPLWSKNHCSMGKC